MNILPKSVQNLIHELSKLPGIGERTASRLTFYLLAKPVSFTSTLGEAIQKLKIDLKDCKTCFNIAESEECVVCGDAERDREKICVVESPLDVIALERSASFKGLYHVLGGAISPIDGIGPDELRIAELMKRLSYPQKGLDNGGESGTTVKEVIIATNPTMEGEATAMYLVKKIKKISPELKVTRIARGLPVGGDLEYADEVTLSRALEGRKDY